VSSGEKTETLEGTTTAAEAGVSNPHACDSRPRAPISGQAIAQSTGLACVLEQANQKKGRRERILDLLCRFHAPVSGIALPFFATNLLACLRLGVTDQSVDETHLRPTLDDIKWLATSNDVACVCPVPKLREGNPTFGRCATSTPHYAAICQIIVPAQGALPDPNKNNALATLQAQLFLLITGTPLAPEKVSAYEESVRLGQSLPPLSESACAAFRGIRYLAKPLREAADILDQLPRGLSPSDFVEVLRKIQVPESPEATRRFHELREHLEFLLAHAPRLRELRGTQRPRESKKPSGSGSHGFPKTGVPRHRVHARRLKPRVEAKIARVCAESDATPDEITAEDQLIVGDSDDPNDDPVRLELLTRAQLRSMHKPIETMPWNVRGLSDRELTPLLQIAAREAGYPNAVSTVDAKRLTAHCVLLTMLFTSRTFDEACEAMLYGPRAQTPQAELAMYFTEDPAEDKLRLVAIKPDYATPEPEPSANVYQPSGFVWLPLPSLLSLVLRAAFSPPNAALDLATPRQLCNPTSEVREQVLDLLADLDPSGRVNLSRIRSTLPARIWEQTEGDLTLASFLSGHKHELINAELHYDGASLRSLAALYREVTES
jgi:hypothetical protein